MRHLLWFFVANHDCSSIVYLGFSAKMDDTVETQLRYSIELLELLPFIVCKHMWLISVSRRNYANSNSNCKKKKDFLHFISVLGKTTILHLLIFGMQAKIDSWYILTLKRSVKTATIWSACIAAKCRLNKCSCCRIKIFIKECRRPQI